MRWRCCARCRPMPHCCSEWDSCTSPSSHSRRGIGINHTILRKSASRFTAYHRQICRLRPVQSPRANRLQRRRQLSPQTEETWKRRPPALWTERARATPNHCPARHRKLGTRWSGAAYEIRAYPPRPPDRSRRPFVPAAVESWQPPSVRCGREWPPRMNARLRGVRSESWDSGSRCSETAPRITADSTGTSRVGGLPCPSMAGTGTISSYVTRETPSCVIPSFGRESAPRADAWMRSEKES